jgi:hypothetical protein
MSSGLSPAKPGRDTPCFAKPYVSLRGVATLRYQDHRAAVVEAELRWNLADASAVGHC